MFSDFFTLDENKMVQPCSVEEWGKDRRNFEGRCRVALSQIEKFRVSTVFLGIDHSLPGVHKTPILFETMIFKKEEDGGVHSVDEDDGLEFYQERYGSWEQALEGHARAISWLKTQLGTQHDL